MFRREYYPSDAIKLVNQSEGKLGAGNKAAHSIAEHLMAKAPGALLYNPASGKHEGVGVSGDDFRDRFKHSPGALNGAFLGKGDMAVVLCEVLNSDIGQEALAALDEGAKRIEVHYLNQRKLKKLFGGLGAPDMNSSNWLVTPAYTEMQTKTFNTKKGSITREIPVKIPKQISSEVKVVDLAMAHVVLDAFDSSLHLQTLFPSSESTESWAKFKLGSVYVRLTIGSDGKGIRTVI